MCCQRIKVVRASMNEYFSNGALQHRDWLIPFSEVSTQNLFRMRALFPDPLRPLWKGRSNRMRTDLWGGGRGQKSDIN